MAHTLASLAARLGRQGELRRAAERLAARTPTGAVLAVKAAAQGAKYALIGSGAAAAAVAAAAAAGTETLPEEYGGRSRWVPPRPLGWLRPEQLGARALSTEELFEQVPALRRQWEPAGRQHVPMPPGECKVTFVEPAGEGDCSLDAATRAAVEAAARAAAVAAAQEVERTGVGRHFLEWGVNVIVTPSREHQACCLPDGTIEVSAGCVARLGQFTDSTEEALAGLLATLAHEMAHHVFRHELESRSTIMPFHVSFCAWVDSLLGGAPDDAKRAQSMLDAAARVQEHLWAREHEADAFAAAVCLALGVRPEHLAANMRAHERHQRQLDLSIIQGMEKLHRNTTQRKLRQDTTRVLADGLHCAPEAVERELSRLRAPGGVDRWAWRKLAVGLLREAAQLADDRQPPSSRVEGPSAGASSDAASAVAEGAASPADGGASQGRPQIFGSPVVGVAGKSFITLHAIHSCPPEAREAVLMKLFETHPPHAARIARIDAAAHSPALLSRRTAPTVPVGGGYAYGRSVAEQLAEQLAERRRQEAGR